MVTALIIVGFTGILFVLLGYLIWKKQKITLYQEEIENGKRKDYRYC